MKKIKTIFKMDFSTGKRICTKEPNLEDFDWVFNGDGIAHQKLDGTCCWVSGSNFFKRRTIKKKKPTPESFIICDIDENTDKMFGWVPVDYSDPADRHHLIAWEYYWNSSYSRTSGTCELCGPSIQGNPERLSMPQLIFHDSTPVFDVPLSYEGLKAWMKDKDIEGLVFHHKDPEDGRMGKIKPVDFGLVRPGHESTIIDFPKIEKTNKDVKYIQIPVNNNPEIDGAA